MVSQSGRKGRLRQLEPQDDFATQNDKLRSPLNAAFGLIPLAVPYEDSPPEARILNAVSAGLLFEGRSEVAEELGMTKAEFTRVLRSLRTSGGIYAGPGGRYRLSFSTANFPNIAAR